MVIVKGVVASGTSGQIAFQLPTGYRPTEGSGAIGAGQGANIGPATVSIDTSGNVVPTGNSGYGITLNGLIFLVD